jgi:hypothetical protein
MKHHPNWIGRQGLKPYIPLRLDVAAKAATHKTHLWDGFISNLKFQIQNPAGREVV